MLPILQGQSEITMTSLQFLEEFINPSREAEGKKPVSNKDFIARVIDELDLSQKEIFLLDNKGNGRNQHYANLDYDQMMLVGMRESKQVRRRVLSMLKELSQPKVPQTKRQWIELALEQEKLLEQQAPKVAFVDNLVNRDALLTATQVAQKHGKSAIWLNRHLVNHDVYNKNVKRSKVFRQWFVDKGFGEMKQNEAGRDQALFTNAGEVWINELILAHGYK